MTSKHEPPHLSPEQPSTVDDRVGVTVITGFLGSGKSTLIRRILTEHHGLRLVVVENEFGANSTIEEAIVTQGVGPSAMEQFIELPNGCICCAAQEDLTDSLSRLLRSRPGHIDHILIEASGLADPGPVAASFWVDEELETGLVLDAVVAVADAVNVDAYLRDGDGNTEKARITQKQLAVADMVLLNKVDLLQGPDGRSGDGNCIDQLKATLRNAGCTANLVPTVRCNIDLSRLMNLRSYDDNVSAKSLATRMPQKFAQHLHTGDSDVGTISVLFDGPMFDDSLMDRVIGELLWEKEDLVTGAEDPAAQGREIWRMKALVAVAGEDFKRIYQSVDTLFDYSTSSVPVEFRSKIDCTSCFIFIGRSLNEAELRASLMKAVAKV